ncbi:hypothetical protein LIP_0343 [Limnochorda pilosa]|uniref:Uncharacterized protein n=1 Tax=Limnochorda pilosa TaxID=1555112 RepID=A0A0K2SGI7_LIMPI|nr:hypothetical protein LIP_0343 [Limnochorda pilosa]
MSRITGRVQILEAFQRGSTRAQPEFPSIETLVKKWSATVSRMMTDRPAASEDTRERVPEHLSLIGASGLRGPAPRALRRSSRLPARVSYHTVPVAFPVSVASNGGEGRRDHGDR